MSQNDMNEAFHRWTWARDKSTKYGELAKKHNWMFEGLDPKEPFYLFGFEVGIGWYEIIERLLDSLEKETEKDPTLKEYFRVVQIKEKYGGLRFYTSCESEKISDLIDDAEQESYVTCEECGKRAKLRNIDGWYTTLCKKCYKKRDAR